MPETFPQADPPVLECRGLRKTYAPGGFSLGGETGVSFTVGRGEFLALVGPSGCGKTTILRLIGGFLQPDAGTVLIEGVDVTQRPPYKRPTNTVFQSYALFPHLSVGANVAFGLTMEGVGRRERQARAAEALALVGLEGFAPRRVSELSGGQQQRAALARALVKRPPVLLLDEPFGALDLRLRKQMQDELARLKGASATTFVHVTHDQEEACAIADRIAVLKDGHVLQVDRPYALFREPRTSFVAAFLDAGTIMRGRATRRADTIEIAAPGLTVRAAAPDLPAHAPVAAVIPPDRISVRALGAAAGSERSTQGSGTVARVVWTGASFLSYVVVAPGLELKASLSREDVERVPEAIAVGAEVAVSWRPEDVIVVDDSDGDATPEPPG